MANSQSGPFLVSCSILLESALEGKNRRRWGSGRDAANLPLWHVGYVELKMIKVQQTQEELLHAPL